MRVLLLIILLSSCLLLAQTGVPIPLPMDNNPGSAPSSSSSMPNLLQMAYDNMLNQNFAQAEQQYHSLSLLEPENTAAWEGLMWAMNMQGKYSSTLKLSRDLAKKQLIRGAMDNYRAFALLKNLRYPEARYHYQKAYIGDPGNPLANQVSQEGLAYAYLGMGDYPRFAFHLNRAAGVVFPLPKARAGFRSTVSYSVPGKDKQAIAFGQNISYKSWKLSAGYEDFRIDSEAFRTVIKAGLGKQFNPLELALSARSMAGEDERVYPAKQVGLLLSSRIYPASLAIKPAVFASYSHYPRFDVQQLSFQPLLLWRDFSLETALHYRYLDNEPVEADSSQVSLQVKLNKQLPLGLNLGLHYGSGNDSWLVDSSGAVIDTFNQSSAYYGLSLSYAFLKRFSLFGYGQTDKTDQLYYVSLSGTY